MFSGFIEIFKYNFFALSYNIKLYHLEFSMKCESGLFDYTTNFGLYLNMCNDYIIISLFELDRFKLNVYSCQADESYIIAISFTFNLQNIFSY
jgi:hypothetical protein